MPTIEAPKKNIPALQAFAKHLPTYTQGSIHRLRVIQEGQGALFSILGVLCDIYIRATHNAKWEVQNGKGSRLILNGDPWSVDVPPEILAWYGISQETSNRLWIMQARGFSFREIGEAIAKQVGKGEGV